MKNNLKIKDIIEVTNANLIQGNVEMECGEFIHDTRKIKENNVFVGIKTDKEDGSYYWEDAFQKGSLVVIINRIDIDLEKCSQWKDRAILIVEDTIEALHKIATYKREKYGKKLKVVAVTGSVGKTSTKDMIANVISQKYKTLKTIGNYNNSIGVPLTILRLKDEEVAVVEMGMNHFNEIRELTKIAKPDLSVITNIGTSHIGNLGSRENILKAKLEILEGMAQKEIIINIDNDMLNKWQAKVDLSQDKNMKIHTFGIENSAQVWADDIKLEENYSTFICHIEEQKLKIRVPVGGLHFVYNALCATLIGNLLGIELTKIKKGIESFELTKKRMEVSKLDNGAIIINDAYNASLESMQAALKNLSAYNKHRKIAILGDIFELGDYTEEIHRKVGKEIAELAIDILVCCGENSKYIIEEAKNSEMIKEIYYFENIAQIKQYLNENLNEGDVVLIKASNGMRFWEILYM